MSLDMEDETIMLDNDDGGFRSFNECLIAGPNHEGVVCSYANVLESKIVEHDPLCGREIRRQHEILRTCLILMFFDFEDAFLKQYYTF